MEPSKDKHSEFEGATPEKPRCQYELWVEEYFGLAKDFPVEGTSPDFDYGQMVSMLAMFDAKRNEFHKANLDDAMNELDLQNESLRSELAKQKELKDELVKRAIDEFLKLAYRSYTLAEIKLVLYSSIKKSDEI